MKLKSVLNNAVLKGGKATISTSINGCVEHYYNKYIRSPEYSHPNNY